MVFNLIGGKKDNNNTTMIIIIVIVILLCCSSSCSMLCYFENSLLHSSHIPEHTHVSSDMVPDKK